MRCLAKSPAARYADVGALAAALAPFGPPDAEAAAARIAQIARRAAARASTASEAAATAPPLAALLAPTPDGLARPSPLPVGGGTLGRNSTLRSSLGEQMRRLRGAARRPWIIVGLVGLGAIAAGVVVALGQRSPAAEAVHEAAAAPAPSAPGSAAPAAPAPAPAAPAPAPAALAPAPAPAPAPRPAAPAPADPAASLHAAQDAYAGGEYERAIVLAKSALHLQPAAAWRILGAASCMRHDAATARAAIGHIDASGRAFVRHACQKAGVALETPRPEAQPDDPWTHLQHDQDTP
jgi:2-oxoglutarate dehydrogenase E2 component (dihydrolipoamide succinyltransferase)